MHALAFLGALVGALILGPPVFMRGMTVLRNYPTRLAGHGGARATHQTRGDLT
jgi:hypothetical protein